MFSTFDFVLMFIQALGVSLFFMWMVYIPKGVGLKERFFAVFRFTIFEVFLLATYMTHQTDSNTPVILLVLLIISLLIMGIKGLDAYVKHKEGLL